MDLGDGKAALRKMFVHTNYRGREYGTARQLLDGLMDWSRARGLRQIYLGTTDKFRAAHRFYEKSGFREITKAELPPNFHFMAVDTKFYALEL